MIKTFIEIGPLDGVDIEGLFYDTDFTRLSIGTGTNFTRIGSCNIIAYRTGKGAFPGSDDGVGQFEGLLFLGFQEIERHPLGGLSADSRDLLQLVY